MDSGQEQQEELVNELDNFFNLRFDANACEQLKQCAIWAKVGAIVNFTVCLILVYLWLFAKSSAFGGSAALTTVVNLLGIGGGLTASFFLYQFAIRAGRGVQSFDALPVNQGFSSLRQYFRANGILIILGMAMLFIGFLVGLMSGLRAG